MPRFIEIRLERRGVSCIARMLDEEAPRTCVAVWDALPLEGDVFHAKYARNEIYTFVPPLTLADPGLENPTITPIPGDVCYIPFSAGQLPSRSYGYRDDEAAAGNEQVVDLALFYGRNNLLLNADIGFVRANVFGAIVENLEAMAEACNDVWRNGSAGERLSFKIAADR
jgi:hypothetical protein